MKTFKVFLVDLCSFQNFQNSCPQEMEIDDKKSRKKVLAPISIPKLELSFGSLHRNQVSVVYYRQHIIITSDTYLTMTTKLFLKWQFYEQYTANVYSGLWVVHRVSLQYLWKRAVRISVKPFNIYRLRGKPYENAKVVSFFNDQSLL